MIALHAFLAFCTATDQQFEKLGPTENILAFHAFFASCFADKQYEYECIFHLLVALK